MPLRLARVAVPVVLLLAAVALAEATRRLDAEGRAPTPLAPTLPYHPQLSNDHASEVAALARRPLPIQFVLARGETLGGVFASLGLAPAEAHAAVEAVAQHLDPRRLRAGDTYAAYFEDGSRLAALELTLDRRDERGRLRLARSGEAWDSSWHPFTRTVASRRLEGELTTSLEAALSAAGGVAVLAYEMADVLQWDLDFNRDLRVGDRFRVLYEEVFLDGRYHRLGPILALIYENRGRELTAFRYGDGYYDAEGRPLKKMFLRSPLRFSRVTSGFSHRRFHPVLKRHRPHYGVDYGAPVGTPVRVTGNGTVTFAGWDRGGGKTVKVRHPSGYLTAYLHLSRFGSGVRRGKLVRQGEVIGYVGSTGLSTAPHLDYRVQHNGRWIDPLTIKSVPAKPIPATEMPTFAAWRQALLASLEDGSPPPADPRDLAAPRIAGSRHAPETDLAAGRR